MPPPATPRIYLVEAEALFARALEDCLRALGYKLCGRAAKGEVALAEIPGLNPDLVLMDIQLAGEINGIETAVRLHTIQDVPVVFLTAFTDSKMIRRVAAAAQFGYLVKPFEEHTLHATLQAAFYKHRTRQLLLSDEDRLELAVQERTVRLSASEAHFRALFHSSPVASSLSDLATGEFIDVNPRFCQLCRRTREELVGHTSNEIGFWDDLRTTREKFRARLAATGRMTDFETSFVRPDGSLSHVSVSAEVFELDGRQVILSGFLDINDRKATEAALRENEALLASINANQPGSCVYRMLHRPDGRTDCVYVSPTVEAIIGMSPAKVIADAATVFSLIHPDDLPAFRRTLADALVSGETIDITARAKHLSGEERWLQLRSRLVERRADGTQVRDGVVVDVTAIKAADIVNKQRAEFFTALHQVTVELLGRHDQAELLQTIVDCCARLFGAAQVELDLVEGEVLVTRGFKGAAVSRMGERATRQEAPLSWQAVDRREPVVVHDYSKAEQARARYLELGLEAAAIFPILHGLQCVGTLGIARRIPGRHFSPEEITQGLLFGQLAALVLHQARIYEDARHEAEARTIELRASEQRLGHALDATSEGVWDWNIRTGEVYFSPQWLRSLGYASAEAAPTFEFCKSIVHPDDLDGMLAAIQAHLEGRTAVYECENRIRTKSGAYRWNLDRGKIVERDAAGAPLRMVGTDTDITERKRADAVLRVKQAQLQVASQIARLGYWEYDVGQDLFHFNDQFYSILRTTAAREGGYTMPSARYAARFVDPQDGELVGVEIGKALATQDPDYHRELDHRVIFGDGQPGYIAVHIRVEKDPAGRTIRTRGAIVDITERKRAEHTVAESVALLRATLESTADGILTVKADGKIQSFNQTFLTMWRIPPEIIASRDDDRTIRFVLDQLRSPEQFLAKVQHLYTHPHEEGFDMLEFKDGRVFERYSRPMLVAGDPAGRVWSFRDVTERKRAEHALMQAHQRASTLAQLGRELSEAATPRTAALAIIEAARLLVGWDCCWLHFWDEKKQMFVDPVNFDLIDGERREIASSGTYPCKPSTFMARIMQEGPQLLLREKEDERAGSLTPFGNMRRSLSLMFGRIQRGERLLGIVSIQSYQHHAYDQEALALLQTLADHCAGALIRIQARAELDASEAALRGSEELFRGVFEASPIPILLSTAPEGRITSANPAALRFFGYVPEEVLGRTSVELGLWVQPEQRAEFFRRILTEKTVPVFEAVLRTKAGAERIMLCTGTLIKLAGQLQVLSSAVDITTVRQFEAEQARIQQRLVQNQKFEALGTLAGGVAHDFNNLLAIISGYTEMSLNQSADPAQVRRNLQKIQHAAQRASGLVQQILTFSRKHEVRYAPFDLNAQVRELVALLAETFPRTVSIVMDLEENLPPLLADQSQVQQILLNLCVNARDAMPSGGMISVGTRLRSGTEMPGTPGVDPAKSYVCIRVTDTGAGITPAVRARLFEPFFTTKAVNKGTGLGLAVIYGIVTSHNGFIEVESTPGVGSTFIAGLPLSDKPVLVPAIAAVREFPRGVESLLVVDDEQSLQYLLEAAFTAKGYRVMTAATGLEAIDWLNRKDQPLDALLLDLNMPGASGLEVARVAKLTRPGVKVLFLSGNMTTEARTELEGLGFSAFMQKPYALDDVGRRLRALLDHGK